MGKKALIIGGSSGIGRATALNLLKDNVEVHVVGTNDRKMEALKNDVKGNLKTHKVDITDEVQV